MLDDLYRILYALMLLIPFTIIGVMTTVQWVLDHIQIILK